MVQDNSKLSNGDPFCKKLKVVIALMDEMCKVEDKLNAEGVFMTVAFDFKKMYESVMPAQPGL